jgi:predicted dehydrogenase
MVSGRVQGGLAGYGLIAGAAHLSYRQELSDRFDVAAVGDISPTRAEPMEDAFGVPDRSTELGTSSPSLFMR